MSYKDKKFAPWPSINFDRQVSNVVLAPLIGTISGEVNASQNGMTLGVARGTGKVTNVIFSVGSCGKDDSDVPTGTVDVKINGTSVFTTQPAIAHVSGEAAQQKTTDPSAGDTGVTAAVIDHDNNSFNAGDVFTWDFTYSGATNPTSKMRAPTILVELDPFVGI